MMTKSTTVITLHPRATASLRERLLQQHRPQWPPLRMHLVLLLRCRLHTLLVVVVVVRMGHHRLEAGTEVEVLLRWERLRPGR